jgi:hypothetical protein
MKHKQSLFYIESETRFRLDTKQLTERLPKVIKPNLPDYLQLVFKMLKTNFFISLWSVMASP